MFSRQQLGKIEEELSTLITMPIPGWFSGNNSELLMVEEGGWVLPGKQIEPYSISQQGALLSVVCGELETFVAQVRTDRQYLRKLISKGCRHSLQRF